MPDTVRNRAQMEVRRYGVSLLAAALATIPLLLTGKATEPSPFLLLLAAVMFSSWYGGVGPALLTTALGTVASVIVFLPPAQALDSAYLRPSLQEGLFVLVALFISYLSADLRQAQQRAREALRQLRRQLELTSAATRNLGEGLYILDEAGRVTYANPAAEQLLGWSRGELLGQSVHTLMQPRSRGSEASTGSAPSLEALQTGATVHVSFDLFCRKDGSLFPVDYVSSPIRSGNQVTGTVVAFRDISHRVRTERRLAAQYQVARDLVEHDTAAGAMGAVLETIGNGFDWPTGELWMLGASGETLVRASTWTNPSFGSPAAETQNDTVRLPRTTGLLGRAFEAGGPVWPDEAVAETDLPWLPTETRSDIHGALAVPLKARSGTVGIMLFFSHDPIQPDGGVLRIMATIGHHLGQFVERKAAEEALRRSEERFRAIFKGTALGVLLTDTGGQVVMSNPVIQELLGYSEEELRGKTLMELTHPDDMPEELDLFQQLVAGRREHYRREERFLQKDNTPIWVHVSMSLIREDGDGPEFAAAMIEDVSARKAVEQQLMHQGLHDSLTGLPNRVLLEDRLESAVLAARRDGTQLAVLLLDLDRFKEVNDTFGHRCGDMLLRQLAGRLRRELRDSDTVARLGGDEFALILPLTAAAEASRMADTIGRSLRQSFFVEKTTLDVQASIGIAVYPDHGEDGATLLRRAEVAMYVAKRGQDAHALYTLEKDEYSPRRLALSGELRRAIERGELTLHYQPKVSLKSGEVDGVEALVRWHHPERGLLMPDQFVPLAEQTGLIKPMTEWLLTAALQQSHAWREDGLSLRIAVNLSARSLHDGQLIETVSRLLNQWQEPASQLEVEVTESAVMGDPERAMEILTRLRDMGTTVSIDDFGTGYSSLAYLTRLPADEIKIDKSFVLSMAASDDAAFIARSVIDLGHYLGLQIVAEGVADQQSWDMLLRLGCDRAQGYYLSRPLSPAACVDWLAHWRSGTARQQLTQRISLQP